MMTVTSVCLVEEAAGLQGVSAEADRSSRRFSINKPGFVCRFFFLLVSLRASSSHIAEDTLITDFTDVEAAVT